jgi:hypothetical protein
MASKGPIIAAGAVTGVLFFWRRKRKAKRSGDEVAGEVVVVDATGVPDAVEADV